MKTVYKLSIVGLVALCMSSCKKFIEIDPPPTSVSAGNVYKDDQTAAAVLTGIYTTLVNNHPFTGTLPSMSLRAEASADNFTLHVAAVAAYKNYYANQLLPIGTSEDLVYWLTSYPLIYTCNAALESLEKSTGLTPSVRNQLKGEALFSRAFFYFYLTNLYGDVPLVISTDYKTNATMARTPIAKVYEQVIADLKEAQNLLGDNYLDAKISAISTDRVRPNKTVATALLARTYLYTGDHVNAESEAGKIIGNSNYSLPTDLNTAFLRTSKEIIWALQPVTHNSRNTDDGYAFALPATGPQGNFPLYFSKSMMDSFEPGDLRKTNWIKSVTASSVTYFYPFKYKISTGTALPLTEMTIALRLAEQYLIRAEARTKQNKLALAITDLDKIRGRAGLPLISSTNPGISQNDLMLQIIKERRNEFFAEWGHRWLDLKRLGLANQVLASIKGATWQSTDVLYPIPESDIRNNPNIIQNPGY